LEGSGGGGAGLRSNGEEVDGVEVIVGAAEGATTDCESRCNSDSASKMKEKGPRSREAEVEAGTSRTPLRDSVARDPSRSEDEESREEEGEEEEEGRGLHSSWQSPSSAVVGSPGPSPFVDYPQVYNHPEDEDEDDYQPGEQTLRYSGEESFATRLGGTTKSFEVNPAFSLLRVGHHTDLDHATGAAATRS
jgi:hypothetical protein